MTENPIPTWGYRHAAQRAADAGATLIWGARAIAREYPAGLDLLHDRQGWSGPDAASAPMRRAWAQRFLDGGGGGIDRARSKAPYLREDEVVEVTRAQWDTDEWESVLVARKAGGYIYLTAAVVPTGTDLLVAS